MEYKKITIDIKDHVCLLTLNHPPVNAIDLRAREELNSVIDELENNDDVRILVITGSGDKAFSAGMDIKDFANIRKGPSGSDICTKLDLFPKPVIAAINGFAYGGGLELALACHFRFMADEEDSNLGLTELNIGIMPGWGGIQRMARLVGRSRAMELILLSRQIFASEALSLGLIDKISAKGEILKDAMDFAARLAKRPPIAVSWVTRSITAGINNGIDAGLKMESEGLKIIRDSEDAREGITAFLEKREPVFKGK